MIKAWFSYDLTMYEKIILNIFLFVHLIKLVVCVFDVCVCVGCGLAVKKCFGIIFFFFFRDANKVKGKY